MEPGRLGLPTSCMPCKKFIQVVKMVAAPSFWGRGSHDCPGLLLLNYAMPAATWKIADTQRNRAKMDNLPWKSLVSPPPYKPEGEASSQGSVWLVGIA